MDSLPVWLLFILWFAFFLLAAEAGYRLGQAALLQSGKESDAPVSTIAGALLALSAFILAFTFSMVSTRYEVRKELVRQAASTVSIAYLRTDFLSQDERSEAQALLREYTDNALLVAKIKDTAQMDTALTNLARIESRLWQTAVANARGDNDSNTASLYVESLNDMFTLRALRISVGLETRVPATIWFVLGLLIALSLVGVGYQTALQYSRRSWSTIILTGAFAVLITLIVLLDRPSSFLLPVSQQPIINARAAMDSAPPAP